MRKDWSDIGWQGVSLVAPPDWNLVAMSGERKRGYFRVDGPADRGVEVRWFEMPKPAVPADRAETYLENLKKATRKKRISFSSRVNPRKPTDIEERTGGSSVGFTWQSDRNAYGRVLWCGVCRRLVIAQVVCPLGQDLSGESAEILGSICSHPEPGWDVWAMYGFRVLVPDSYRLRRQTLMSGYLQLVFVSRRGELTIERWGLANMLTRDKGLAGWYDYEYRPENSSFVLSVDVSNEGGHETLEVSGKRKLLATIGGFPRSLVGRGKPARLAARVWLCPESNRIYGVRMLYRRDPSAVPEVAKRLRCH